jgi:hypothetical protein
MRRLVVVWFCALFICHRLHQIILRNNLSFILSSHAAASTAAPTAQGMDDELNVNKGKKEAVMDSEEMGGVPSLSVGIVCQKKYKEWGEHVNSANFLLGVAIKGMEDEENTNKGKKEVEMESEEMGGLTSLLVGIVCQKPYKEPDERLSAALFLLGSAINDANDDQDDLVSAPNKMEIGGELEEEGWVMDMLDDVALSSNDSNKYQCIPLSIVDPPKTPNPIQKRPRTSNKFGRGKRRGGDRKSTGAVGMILSAPEAEAADNDYPEAEAEDNGGVAGNCPATINKKKLTKAQIIVVLTRARRNIRGMRTRLVL